MRGKFPFLQKIWRIGARHAEDISPDGSNGKQADHTYRNAAQQAGRAVPLTAKKIHGVATDAARRISDPDGDRTGDHAAEEVSAGTRGHGPGVGSNADQGESRDVLSAAVREEVRDSSGTDFVPDVSARGDNLHRSGCAGGGESEYSRGIHICRAVHRSRSYVQWGEPFRRSDGRVGSGFCQPADRPGQRVWRAELSG